MNIYFTQLLIIIAELNKNKNILVQSKKLK